jgi:hypothetical protein
MLKIMHHRATPITHDGVIRIVIEAWKRCLLPCGISGKPAQRLDLSRERMWKHIPLWEHPVAIVCRP